MLLLSVRRNTSHRPRAIETRDIGVAYPADMSMCLERYKQDHQHMVRSNKRPGYVGGEDDEDKIIASKFFKNSRSPRVYVEMGAFDGMFHIEVSYQSQT